MTRRRAKRPFTEAELSRIEDLLADGVSYKEIGRTLDRHAGTILRTARERGWQSEWSNTSGYQARQLNQMLASVPVFQ